MTKGDKIIVTVSVILLAFLMLILQGCEAKAQTPVPMPSQQLLCGNTDEVMNNLMVQYGEQGTVDLKRNDDFIFRLMLDGDDGSWTIIRISPDKETACFMTAGKEFNRTEWVPPTEEREG